ncbi:unnamed protein product [Owenia fusiformis]|uniref:U4/U6 small nuclear ribonucleoprotein Prp31 n=1 Tax=Owenia fusiformis TaxID=6347 RepID=A0A8J1UQI5_OWEFU|nr:unnamed protein product [Owenia fusiformis]
MSLADELLADLEEDEADEADNEEQNEEQMGAGAPGAEEAAMEVDIGESVRAVAKLRDSKELADVMRKIAEFQSKPKRTQVVGIVEADPEYLLIVDANNLTVEIDNEINVIHKFTRDIYCQRFPELESLVPNSMEYLKTARELGNQIDKSKNNEVLQEILTSATIMVVSVTASTTQGTKLTNEELDRVYEACDMAVELVKYKQQIFDYVESRMAFIAPNLTLIIGASTAAKIMGVAGGLSALSKMPACNILLLGAQKKTLSGFSQTAAIPHAGFVYYSDVVQKTPPDLRRKAARLVSAKCTLAARVDSFHESSDGHVGDNLRAEIDEKLDKLQEPPPVKAIKPLPAPIDAAKKKRGGRRARKMKERLGMSEMRKQANRMTFGAIEDDAYQDTIGFSVGNLGKSGSNRVRGPLVDAKTKAKISKTLQQKLSKQKNNVWGGSTTVKKAVSGTASSVAFTPLQGLEIVNPLAAEARTQEAQKYFSSTSSFVKVTTPLPGSSKS